jgi:hypothetical protein
MFADLIACLAEFCKNKKTPKVCVQAIELFLIVSVKLNDHLTTRRVVQNVIGTPSSVAPKETDEDLVVKYWMPILFSLHGIIMTSELDVRTK